VSRLIGVVASVVLLAGAPACQACNLPDIRLAAKEAGPGDWVGFEISGTDPGAGYKVFAYGEEVLAGTDDDGGGVTGVFQMPDLGQSSLLAAVEVNVTHPSAGSSGGDYHGGAPWWGSTRDVHYRAAPAPAAEPAATEPAAPPPERAGAPARQDRQRAVRGRVVRPRQRARPRRSARARARARRRATRARPSKRRPRAQEADVSTTPVPVPAPPVQQRPGAAHDSGGMKTAVLVLLGLTAGGAAYGRMSARRRRII
jgi:hypothetical protein